MIYGYTRVSTDQQNTENQKHEILTFAETQKIKIDKWVDEVISSRKSLKERRLGKTLKHLKKGDILIASELSRLGRNLFEVMGILQSCLEKDCQIWTLKEHYRLGADIQSKVLAFAFSLAAEIERQLISQRTKESLKRIKDEGKHLGRPHGFSYKKLDSKKGKIQELLEKQVSKAEIARLLNCSWLTLHRYIQKAL
ncbi:master DNA invertase Mpi family serine-type recombinase [bacterium]|nr:master DNA invertase Mpi family serine-type recombinase [bacterium]